MTKQQELEDQLALARKDIETLAKLAGDRAREIGHDRVAQAQAGLESLSDEARAAYDSAVRQGQRARAATEDQIRAHPLAATGMAFAAGFVLAGLLGRK